MKYFFLLFVAVFGTALPLGQAKALSAEEAQVLLERFVVNEPSGQAAGSDRVFRWQGEILVGVAATGEVSGAALSSVRNTTDLMASFRVPMRAQEAAAFTAANFRVFLIEHLAWQQNGALVEMLAPHLFSQPVSSTEVANGLFGDTFDMNAGFGRQCVTNSRSDGRRLTDAYILVDASLPQDQMDACITYGFLRNLGLLGPDFSLQTVVDPNSPDMLSEEARTAVWMLYAPGVEPGMGTQDIIFAAGQ